MGSENREISRYEITAVYTHPEAKADIVFVHGLNAEPDITWTAKDGTFWPLDLLPAALEGTHANILIYGYNADVYSKGNDRTTSNHFISQHAEDLVTNLMLHRRSQGTSKNPIIWVCHSLGGILVKRALLYSHDVRETHLEDLGSIYISTFGLIFLATPHVGSDAAAWGVIVQAMAAALIPRRFFDSEPVLLKTLRKDNETLVNINSHFLDIYQRFEVHMVRENQKTDVKGKKFFVVDAHSAGPPLPGVTYYGIEANHVDMCKFESINSPGFRNIAITLQQWIKRASFLIQERWLAAEEEGRNRALAKVNEIMSPFAAHQMYAQNAILPPYPSVNSTLLPAYDYDESENRAVPRIHSAGYSEASLNPAFGYWVRGYASQPISPRSGMSVPYNSVPAWPSQAPSIAATGPPLPWHRVTPGNAPLDYQAWPPRQTGPWNFYDIAYAPRQHMSPETVHVSEIESLPPENHDTRQEETESHPPDYCQPRVPE
ncbi:hypothetical protein HYE67_007292 [Fusarium culmorum]|uniref:AB hydrolase-1 domain-containing protein n=1 Tax=Fusarium culmorum TaxID=5516 RepID=A0A7S8DAS5_FUSCU|nr:hypothetical protein HYE67_007292 [Fusarium culmorum]